MNYWIVYINGTRYGVRAVGPHTATHRAVEDYVKKRPKTVNLHNSKDGTLERYRNFEIIVIRVDLKEYTGRYGFDVKGVPGIDGAN